jgi:hypothetical protein
MQSVFAIGGETTGTALVTADGDFVELDLDTNGFASFFQDGFEATVEGVFVDVRGVEIPTRRVLRVSRMTRSAAPF